MLPVSSTEYGVDLDIYDISSRLTAGDNSAQTTYSSGGDLVLLSAEIISATNTAVVDLDLTKSHSGDFSLNGLNTFALDVANNGPSTEAASITVTDPLPTGLTYVSFSSTDLNWACNAIGQDVTCTHPGPIAPTASLAQVLINVTADATALPSLSNTATVTSTTFDFNATNNASTDNITVLAPNLTTSSKTVADLNGGQVLPGDTLRYTISIVESAGEAAFGVSGRRYFRRQLDQPCGDQFRRWDGCLSWQHYACKRHRCSRVQHRCGGLRS